jgi:ribosome-binding protein aMBF1 (putative translation factor)
MLIDQAIGRVRAYRQSKGWSVLRLAKEAGIRESTIRHLDHDDWSPTAGTLRKLERVIPPDFDAAQRDSSVNAAAE